MEDREPAPAMRRRPRQERGRQRVAQLLDAAEELFGVLGYEAATTNQIAAQAGVPIGSLYQYFPNKEAILHAVAERYRTVAADALGAALGPEVTHLPAAALAEQVLTAMVTFGTSRIGFTKMVLQAGAHPHLAAAAGALMDDAAATVGALLDRRHPGRPAGECRLAARVALAAVMALLSIITAEKPRGQAHVEALMAETHTLLAAYLEALDRRAAGGTASDGTIG